MSSVKQQRQQDFGKLNQLLHHPDRKAVEYGQDEQTKQENTLKEPQAPIKRYVAIALVKLMKKKRKITIHTIIGGNNVTAKECDTNTLALFKSLKSIKFITTSTNFNGLTAKITPLGKQYVKNNIPNYKRIYKYLKYGKESMKKSAKTHNNFDDSSDTIITLIYGLFAPIPIILLTLPHRIIKSIVHFFTPSIHLVLTSNSISGFLATLLIFVVAPILVIILAIIIRCCLHYNYYDEYKNENISQDISGATRENFINFLKDNHIPEPNYRFGHDNHLPKIDNYLFNRK